MKSPADNLVVTCEEIKDKPESAVINSNKWDKLLACFCFSFSKCIFIITSNHNCSVL